MGLCVIFHSHTSAGTSRSNCLTRAKTNLLPNINQTFKWFFAATGPKQLFIDCRGIYKVLYTNVVIRSAKEEDVHNIPFTILDFVNE